MHPGSKRSHIGSLLPDNVFARLQAQTRRHFLRSLTGGIGSMFLGTLASQAFSTPSPVVGGKEAVGRLDLTRDPRNPLTALPPQFAPRAKRIIYLHMGRCAESIGTFRPQAGADKVLTARTAPRRSLAGKRFAFITGRSQALGTQYPFHQSGKSGQWISDRLPHLEKHIDDLCFIKSMRTDQFNHAPAQLLVQNRQSAPWVSFFRFLGRLRPWH